MGGRIKKGSKDPRMGDERRTDKKGCDRACLAPARRRLRGGVGGGRLRKTRMGVKEGRSRA